MKKVIINIPTDKSSTYGKETQIISGKENILRLWKKVDNTNHIFFGNNEFISLLYDKQSNIKDPQTNSAAMSIQTFDEFKEEYTDIENEIESVVINSGISPLMNIYKEGVES